MASKTKLKLFHKLGGQKKNKPLLAVSSDEHVTDQVDFSEDYSMPPDCDEDDGLYCEPADSLNSSSTNPSPNKFPSINPFLSAADHSADKLTPILPTPPSSVEAVVDISPTSTDTSYTPDYKSTSATRMTSSIQQINSLSASVNSNCSNTDTTGGQASKSIENSHINKAFVPSSGNNLSSSVYMNESQFRNEELKTSAKKPLCSTSSFTSLVTPIDDPRNNVTGDEYDCPWDLRDTETEIYELVKQAKNKATIADSPVQLRKQSVSSLTKVSPTTQISRQAAVKSTINPETSSNNKVALTKRQSSLSTLPSAVLVEGEWREAKTVLASTPSPDLTSPLQIHSHNLVSNSNANAASNVIYDRNNDDEIQARLRFTDERPKVPCAQPRSSVSSAASISVAQDAVYLNFQEFKPATGKPMASESDVYDDPWNVDKVQQDILEKIKQQQQQSLTSLQRQTAVGRSDHRSSDASPALNVASSPPNKTDTHRMSLQSSTTPMEAADKLSTRVVSGTRSHQTSQVPPPIPKTNPPASHATKTTKPVLVVQRTNVAVVPPPLDRENSTSRGGAVRKKSSSEVPECQRRIGLTVNKNLPLTQQPWYHGAIQRYYAEDLLRKRPDGSFLIRDTSGSNQDKTLSLKNSSGFIHIKIVRQADGTYILGQFSHPFKSIMEMIDYYSRHKVNIKGAEHTYLEIPVYRDQ